MLIKVDYKDITLSRLCHYYLSESTCGTNTKTMFFSPYTYIHIYACINAQTHFRKDNSYFTIIKNKTNGLYIYITKYTLYKIYIYIVHTCAYMNVCQYMNIFTHTRAHLYVRQAKNYGQWEITFCTRIIPETMPAL